MIARTLYQYQWPTGSVTLVLATSEADALAQIARADIGSGPVSSLSLRPATALLLTLDPGLEQHDETVAICAEQTGEVPAGGHHHGWRLGDLSETTVATLPSHADILAAEERERLDFERALNDATDEHPAVAS